MAIDTTTYSGQEFRIALAEQTAFGTAFTTPMSGFQELDVRGFSFPDFSGILSDNTRRATGQRVKTITEYFRSNAGSDYTWEVSGVATLQTIAQLVYGVMQDIDTEEDELDDTKVFEWDGSTFAGAGDPPKVFTVALYSPVSTERFLMQDCVIKTLTFTCDVGSAGGRGTYKATFWTGHRPTWGATVAPGTDWISPGVTYFTAQTLATKTVLLSGGSALEVICPKYEITWENGASRVGYDSTGDAQSIHFDAPVVTGSIDVKYDANTKDTIDKWFLSPTDGAADIQIELAHTGLGFSIHGVLTAPPAMDASERGLYQTLTWEGCTESTDEAIAVTISDNVLRGWIGA